jgi:hypothetical protein
MIMFQNRINITPTNTLKLNNISSFTIANFNVNLFNSAFINVILNDTSNNVIQTVNINLTKEEYDGWTSDDNYIINLVANKLGFEMKLNSDNTPVLGYPNLILPNTPSHTVTMQTPIIFAPGTVNTIPVTTPVTTTPVTTPVTTKPVTTPVTTNMVL